MKHIYIKGAGNNWAQGYEMCSGEFAETALDCVRRELEFVDNCPFLVVTHSLAGGTGSGLGTRITEQIGDEFSDCVRMNVAITPYHFGEVVVQHYNAVLSLAKVASSSDAVLLFENEVAQYMCKQTRGIERPTLGDINELIASHLVPILLPSNRLSYSDPHTSRSNSISNSNTTRCDLGESIRHLCPHSGFKFIDVKTVPQTPKQSVEYTYDTWHSLINTISRMQIRGSYIDRSTSVSTLRTPGLGAESDHHHLSTPQRNSTVPSAKDTLITPSTVQAGIVLASVLTLHGPEAAEESKKVRIGPKALDSLSQLASPTDKRNPNPTYHYSVPHSSLLYTSTSSSLPSSSSTGGAVEVRSSQYALSGYPRSASLLSNSTAVLPLLQRVTARAQQLFGTRAYVHQYNEFGVSETDFVDSFRKVGQIITNYESLK